MSNTTYEIALRHYCIVPLHTIKCGFTASDIDMVAARVLELLLLVGNSHSNKALSQLPMLLKF
jgi:hypothetical protein